MRPLGSFRPRCWLLIAVGLQALTCVESHYCVEGFHEGEVLEVRIVSYYNRDSGFQFVGFDIPPEERCSDFDLPIGSTFRVLVGKDVDHPSCVTRTGTPSGFVRISDLQLRLETQGAARAAVNFGTLGGRVGMNCLGRWDKFSLGAPGRVPLGDPFREPEVGQRPPLILTRLFAPNPGSEDACRAEGANLKGAECYDDFVVKVTRISP